MAKVQDVRPFIKKMVKSNKINYGKLHRVFRESARESESFTVKKSQSFKIDKSIKNLDEKLERSKSTSQTRGQEETKSRSIKSQYKPIIAKKNAEEIEDPTDTTKETDKDISKTLKSK